jgi:alkylmercury lyase
LALPTTLVELANQWELALPSIADEDRRIGLTGVRMLADGHAVEVERLAHAVGRPETEVADRLSRLFAVYFDDRRRLIGMWGLFLIETPHQLLLDGRRLYAGCAGDALFLPFVLDRSARVESTDPTNGTPVALTVSPAGVGEISPSGAATSLMIPEREDVGSDDPRGSVCSNHHFFVSMEAAAAWTAKRESVMALSLEDGFAISRWWAARLFGIGDDGVLDPRRWA